MTSFESQLRWFSVDIANKIKERYIIKRPKFKDKNIDCLLKKLNKAKTSNNLSRFLNEVESFKSNGLKTKSVKRIYKHIGKKLARIDLNFLAKVVLRRG
ncbi:hypothetical protein BD408DRAFT_216761 [Parasitella parasitica]|nr:hypothetical protein BD408DRAFT_216761 [Parasitella parasitica]